MSEEKANVELEQEVDQEQAETAEEQQPQEADAAEETPDLAAEVERWKAAAEEHHNRYLRAMADMENMRKRLRKEMDDLTQYASLKVIAELLPALDNFERALAADKESLTVDSLLQGVSMVYRQMVQVFEREGLTPIEAAGKPFDPHHHQAVMQVEDPAFESGVVVEELQKGYMFKDRVVRPAMVKVNA
ncbi:nucleotide exchange factor GrpE [Brevibacillus sp. SYP-B805]|uniref:nucleotide exchange factor GrpE n=1 Tax=Brevibacillus sp. SYP-B805 TaxID=1578199 RepID=UPI0013ED055F|nr:nucleotide exchange factor GrpE [Brevibacillus sp. SYP-B805]NGQ94143.1 nucleotide exchange factor GrpE [Brevibacillus sp. SYP-B805]